MLSGELNLFTAAQLIHGCRANKKKQIFKYYTTLKKQTELYPFDLYYTVPSHCKKIKSYLLNMMITKMFLVVILKLCIIIRIMFLPASRLTKTTLCISCELAQSALIHTVSSRSRRFCIDRTD